MDRVCKRARRDGVQLKDATTQGRACGGCFFQLSQRAGQGHPCTGSKDLRKLEYAVAESTDSVNPFLAPALVADDIQEAVSPPVGFSFSCVGVSRQAIQWIADHSPEEEMRFREQMVSELEAAGSALQRSGWSSQWFDGADSGVTRVAGEANGHLFGELLRVTGYVDASCVEILREGACMLEQLPVSGIGAPIDGGPTQHAAALQGECVASNKALVRSLREDAHSRALLQSTEADAKLHRMSQPVPVEGVSLQGVRLQPRFAVVQSKPDGTEKIRPVDDFSWSVALPVCCPVCISVVL